jgi:hypothetical protein
MAEDEYDRVLPEGAFQGGRASWILAPDSCLLGIYNYRWQRTLRKIKTVLHIVSGRITSRQ